MADRRGFFSFFKSGDTQLSDEEKKQRDYALEKEKEEEQELLTQELKVEVVKGPEISSEISNFCEEKLKEILSLAKLEGDVEQSFEEDNTLNLDISESEDLGRIIGREGNTLDSLQTLIRSIAYKKFGQPIRLIVDAGGYKKRRVEAVKTQALEAAKKVLANQKKVKLDAMSATERRIVHLMFENHADIQSFSIGDRGRRSVVLERRAAAE